MKLEIVRKTDDKTWVTENEEGKVSLYGDETELEIYVIKKTLFQRIREVLGL